MLASWKTGTGREVRSDVADGCDDIRDGGGAAVLTGQDAVDVVHEVEDVRGTRAVMTGLETVRNVVKYSTRFVRT